MQNLLMILESWIILNFSMIFIFYSFYPTLLNNATKKQNKNYFQKNSLLSWKQQKLTFCVPSQIIEVDSSLGACRGGKITIKYLGTAWET